MDKLQELMDAAQDLAVADYRDGQNTDLVIATVNARNRMIEALASGEVVVIDFVQFAKDCDHGPTPAHKFCRHPEVGGCCTCKAHNCPRLPR